MVSFFTVSTLGLWSSSFLSLPLASSLYLTLFSSLSLPLSSSLSLTLFRIHLFICLCFPQCFLSSSWFHFSFFSLTFSLSLILPHSMLSLLTVLGYAMWTRGGLFLAVISRSRLHDAGTGGVQQLRPGVKTDLFLKPQRPFSANSKPPWRG